MLGRVLSIRSDWLSYAALVTSYGPAVNMNYAHRLFFESDLPDLDARVFKTLPQLLTAAYVAPRVVVRSIRKNYHLDFSDPGWTSYLNCAPHGCDFTNQINVPRAWLRCDKPMLCPSCWFRSVFLRFYGPVHYFATFRNKPTVLEFRRLDDQYGSYDEYRDRLPRIRASHKALLVKSGVPDHALHTWIDYDPRSQLWTSFLYTAMIMDASTHLNDRRSLKLGTLLYRSTSALAIRPWWQTLRRNLQFESWWIRHRKHIGGETIAEIYNQGYPGYVTFSRSMKGLIHAHDWTSYELRYLSRRRKERTHGDHERGA